MTSGPSARISAQAKLNLHLRILAREQNGYHSIETIFHRIDLSDQILVAATDRAHTIDVVGGDVGPAEKNLAYRAADAYSAFAGWPKGFSIELTKKIPSGAGLGGGSADAAAVLRALDFLSPQPIGSDALLRIAATLGSDVPFLTSDAVMALAWGRGERMIGLPHLDQKELLLITPDTSVSTADAYRWIDEGGNDAPASDSTFFVDPKMISTWSGIASFARNDFEQVVFERHPELGRYVDVLRNCGASFAQMTGSGSTFFGMFDSHADVQRIPEEHRGRVTTTKTSTNVVQPLRVG